MMRKIVRKTVVGAGIVLVALAPAGSAFAAARSSAAASARPPVSCSSDQVRRHLRDGTGLRCPVVASNSTQASGAGYQHQSGPMDGSGPRAAPAQDGTGLQWHPWSRS